MVGPLPSPRHEVFAQALACGMSAAKAYSLAYARPRTHDREVERHELPPLGC